jgi:uncharacterized membrane protein
MAFMIRTGERRNLRGSGDCATQPAPHRLFRIRYRLPLCRAWHKVRPVTQTSRTAAQQRADDIRAFRAELTRLETDGIVALSAEQTQAVRRHHDGLLAGMAAAFDIDRDVRAKQLSWGMRIASFFGALALAASVFFLFFQFWGVFSETAQVVILIGASLGTLGLTFWVQGRDVSGYFTKLAALVAFACFVLNVSMLGQIFNITPSDKALLPWAALALLLAYACDLRLLLVAGLVCLDIYVAARFGEWNGLYWLSFGSRPEHFIPFSIALYLLPQFVPHPRREDFPSVYRLVGLITLLLVVLSLSHWAANSYLPWDKSIVESFHQIIGFALSASAILLGLRRQWPGTTNTGTVFFVIFLFTKFFDWWWEIMPKWLFFLLIGLTSVLFLLIIMRVRKAADDRSKP